MELGQSVSFASGELYGAGHYLAVIVAGESTQTCEFDVVPSQEPGSLGFLAKPSRLPVNTPNGISGAVYVFDKYRNLVTQPLPVTLELKVPNGTSLKRSLTTHNGLAWTKLDSASKEGIVQFTARVGSILSSRVIDQVPGDPCSISIEVRPHGSNIEVQTSPVHDCSGNMIPDGTVITFSEIAGNLKSTVDVPLKHGRAITLMPAISGAKISVASGAVAGNEVRLGNTR